MTKNTFVSRRIFLLAGAVGWGISILGVLLPWRVMDRILQNMGALAAVSDVQLRYWFRMATGSWSVMGFFFLMAFLRPRKYADLVPLLALGSLFEGAVLLFHGLILGVPLFPFAGDAAFCLIVGTGLYLTEPGFGKVRYPLLEGRTADASAWRFDDVDISITAAYLETVADAFSLEDWELFRLRPVDSLFALYDSLYKGRPSGGVDDMELETCCGAFETLCRFSGAEFDYKAPLRDVLRTVARNRENAPLGPEEIKNLRLSMRLLESLSAPGAGPQMQ